MWNSVPGTVTHAKTDEVEREILAQIDRAEKMGFHPTHLDTHMGTVFGSPAFLDRYVRIGIEKHIPVMMPGGHDTYIQSDPSAPKAPGIAVVRALGKTLWDAGLPVLDDLHNTSYGWPIPSGAAHDDEKLRAWRTERYIATISELKPGLTMVIMHCTAPTEVFESISSSGTLRKADMLAMLDPKLQAFLKEQGFIVTTWAEAMERRKRAH